MTDRERTMLTEFEKAKTLIDWIDTEDYRDHGSEDFVERVGQVLDRMEEIAGRKSAELKGLTVRCDLCSAAIPAEEAPALCTRCGGSARAHARVAKADREWKEDGSP